MKAVLEKHPLSEKWDDYTEDELLALENDIRLHGQRLPIILFEGKILDGRHRYKACIRAKVDPMTEAPKLTYKEAVALVESLNERRRHRTPSQLAMTAARNTMEKKGFVSGDTTEVSEATRLGVSRSSISRAKRVIKKGVPEIVKAVDDGKLDLKTAARVVKRPGTEQKKIAAKGVKEIKKVAAQIARPIVRGGLAADALAAKSRKQEDSPKAQMLAALEQWWTENKNELTGYGAEKPGGMVKHFRELIEETL